MNKTTPIQLAGKSFDLRFDFAALLALEEKQQVNVFAPETYRNASPSLVVKVLWAGMLHIRPDLTLAEVVPLIEVKNLATLNKTLMDALSEAISGEPEANVST